mmetsp:Transcript_15609/g.39641  ORF Transcript_15609/g.39641 Transcript_15609/m.39641 type:complete len:120 (+) Transcript_15609:686-1045(+)
MISRLELLPLIAQWRNIMADQEQPSRRGRKPFHARVLALFGCGSTSTANEAKPARDTSVRELFDAREIRLSAGQSLPQLQVSSKEARESKGQGLCGASTVDTLRADPASNAELVAATSG